MTRQPRLRRTSPAPKVGIVHIGPGAFFRSFVAAYTDEAMVAAGGDWGITAISLRSATARDDLVPQEGVFTTVELAPEGRRARIVGAIADVMVAAEDIAAVRRAMTDPAIKIVSLTITEKGYCHAPATGRLRLDHPDIAYDLVHPDAPRSAPGLLVSALAARREKGVAPFTVLSCDNLSANGRLARGVVLEFAAHIDAVLAQWIADHVPFPATMVDRITPATTEADIALLAEAEGHFDPACVTHEPFRQWVIEDDFAQGRPAWERAGAQIVTDVARHETMKLRCLNGTHSTLAYLGYLAGYEAISDTVADPDFARLCEALWQLEIVPTVPPPQGEDLPAYCQALLTRYRNPAIRHRTWQIAMDGSQKLPPRLLAPIAENLAAGRPSPGLCLAVAGWMRFVGGIDEDGRQIDVRDPLAERLKAASDSAKDPAGKVAALLAIPEIFDPDLAAHPQFRADVLASFTKLTHDGVKATVRGFLAHIS